MNHQRTEGLTHIRNTDILQIFLCRTEMSVNYQYLTGCSLRFGQVPAVRVALLFVLGAIATTALAQEFISFGSVNLCIGATKSEVLPLLQSNYKVASLPREVSGPDDGYMVSENLLNRFNIVGTVYFANVKVAKVNKQWLLTDDTPTGVAVFDALHTFRKATWRVGADSLLWK
jgi:hypothetical protein